MLELFFKNENLKSNNKNINLPLISFRDKIDVIWTFHFPTTREKDPLATFIFCFFEQVESVEKIFKE